MDPALALAADFDRPSHDDWLAAVDKVLRGADFDRVLVSETDDGLDIQPLYTADSVPLAPDQAGMPGAAHLLRGAAAAPRPHGAWDIRSVVDHPEPGAANAQALEELTNGATSLEIVLDLDGSGYGVSIRTPEELSSILDGVLFDVAPVAIRAGVHGPLAGTWLLDALDASGTDVVGGHLGIDACDLLAVWGEIPQGVERFMADAAALATRAIANQPRLRTLVAGGTGVAAAGASEAQEIAWILASGAYSLRALTEAGLSVRDAASQITLEVTADVDVFATIAKLRALRWGWSTVLTASGLDVDAASERLVHVGTRSSWRHLTTVDPWVNLLRGTAACFGAVIGGADTVIVAPFDGADGRAGDLGRRLARNTQLLLQDESGLGQVIDPAGGSWFIESLTERLARAAWDSFQDIERAGGPIAVLESGEFASQIAEVADRRQKAVASRRRPITGVSEFPLLAEARPNPPAEVAPDDRPAVALEGSPTSVTPLPIQRLSEPFEQLRSDAEASAQTPTVWLANIGPIAKHTARASFAANFFATGGVATAGDDGHDDADALASAFAASGHTVACICGADDDYADHAAAAAQALTAAGANRIYLAGRPGEHEDAWRAAGIDAFVGIGTDVLATLTDLHTLLELR